MSFTPDKRTPSRVGRKKSLTRFGIEDTRDIRIRPLAQTFLAVQGEIVRMRQLPSVFENQKLYGETFREAYLQSDARRIILCYKVHLMIRSAMKRLEERAGENIRYAITKARDLVWALLIQGMLNDPNLPRLLDTYGTGLKKDAEFREYLMNMASGRLLPVLRKLLGEDENRKKLAAEKYEFMRSVPVFKKCMDIRPQPVRMGEEEFVTARSVVRTSSRPGGARREIAPKVGKCIEGREHFVLSCAPLWLLKTPKALKSLEFWDSPT